MSAGRFEISKYESDEGDIFSIRVQPETLAATLGGGANAAPAGAVDGTGSVRVGGGNRQIGIKARSVTIRWDEGEAPTGYDERTLLRIPVLTQARYNAAALGSAVTYLGAGATIVGKNPERVR